MITPSRHGQSNHLQWHKLSFPLGRRPCRSYGSPGFSVQSEAILYTSQACEASSPKATVLVYSLGWHYIEVGQHAGVRAGRLLQPACAQFATTSLPLFLIHSCFLVLIQ